MWSGLRTHTPCCFPDGRVKPVTAVSTVSEDENITFQLSYPEIISLPIYIFLRGIQSITIPAGLDGSRTEMFDFDCNARSLLHCFCRGTVTSCAAQ